MASGFYIPKFKKTTTNSSGEDVVSDSSAGKYTTKGFYTPNFSKFKPTDDEVADEMAQQEADKIKKEEDTKKKIQSGKLVPGIDQKTWNKMKPEVQKRLLENQKQVDKTNQESEINLLNIAKAVGGATVDVGKNIVSGVQQGVSNVADVSMQASGAFETLKSDINPFLSKEQKEKNLQQIYLQTEAMRNILKNNKTITGEKLNPSQDFQFSGDTSKDIANLAGRGLETGLNATMFVNPTRLAAGGSALSGKQLIKPIAKEMALFGGGQGLATGAKTYGETGDVGTALQKGAESGATAALSQGALEGIGALIGKIRKTPTSRLKTTAKLETEAGKTNFETSKVNLEKQLGRKLNENELSDLITKAQKTTKTAPGLETDAWKTGFNKAKSNIEKQLGRKLNDTELSDLITKAKVVDKKVKDATPTGVTQIVNNITKEKKFITPKTTNEHLASMKAIDQPGGVAGIQQTGGDIYHVTAKTPEQMKAQGFTESTAPKSLLGKIKTEPAPQVTKTEPTITAYHGSTNDKLTSLEPGIKTGLNEKRNLLYLTEDKISASHYTKNRGTDGTGLGILSDAKTGKVYETQVNGKVIDAYNRDGGLSNLKTAKGYDTLSVKTKNQLNNDTGLSADILETNPELVKFLKDNDITAVRGHLNNSSNGATELIVVNPSKTKLSTPQVTKTPTEININKAPIIELPKPKDNQFNSKVFERMKAEHPELQGEATAEHIKLKEDTDRAVSMIESDKQKAFEVAMGKSTSPDVTSTSVNIAMSEKALGDGNNKLASQLIKKRSLDQTRRGQELVSERGSVSDNSTQRYVKELLANRMDKLGKGYLSDLKLGKVGTKERSVAIIDKNVDKVMNNIKNKKLDTKTAIDLLDRMTCI